MFACVHEAFFSLQDCFKHQDMSENRPLSSPQKVPKDPKSVHFFAKKPQTKIGPDLAVCGLKSELDTCSTQKPPCFCGVYPSEWLNKKGLPRRMLFMSTHVVQSCVCWQRPESKFWAFSIMPKK